MSYTQIFSAKSPFNYAKPITLGAANKGFSTAIRRTQEKQATSILKFDLYGPDLKYAGYGAEIRVSWGNSGTQNVTVWLTNDGKQDTATMRDRGGMDEGISNALWAIGFDCDNGKYFALQGECGIESLAKWLLTHEPEGFVVFSKTHP